VNKRRSELVSRLKSEAIETKWGPSPVEIWKSKISSHYEGDVSDFRRRKISSGTINPPDRPKKLVEEPYPNDSWYRRVINTVTLMKLLGRLEVHSLLFNGSLFKYCPELNSHKFRRFSIPNNYLSEIGIRMSYYSHRIKKMGLENPVILEIGAGYGSLSNYLKGNYSKYIIVDLIENLILSSEYLSEAGLNFDVFPVISDDDDSIHLLAGGDIQKLDNVDIVVNTMSMQHMSEENLKYYFNQINRLNPALIYLVNRNIKRDPTDIEIQNYPVPKRYKVKKRNFIFSRNYSEILFERKT